MVHTWSEAKVERVVQLLLSVLRDSIGTKEVFFHALVNFLPVWSSELYIFLFFLPFFVVLFFVPLGHTTVTLEQNILHNLEPVRKQKGGGEAGL